MSSGPQQTALTYSPTLTSPTVAAVFRSQMITLPSQPPEAARLLELLMATQLTNSFPEELEASGLLPLTVERMLREESPPSCPRDGFRSPTSTWEVIKFPEKLTRFGGSPEMERPPVWQRCLLVRQFIVLLRLIYFVNSALRPMSDFVS